MLTRVAKQTLRGIRGASPEEEKKATVERICRNRF